MSKPRNKMEAAYQRKHPDLEYESIKLNYVLNCTYTPDFIDRANKTIFETKGLWEPADRRKTLAVIQQNPEWRVVMIFQNPQRKIAKRSKTTYAAFCDRHGIEWQQFKY